MACLAIAVVAAWSPTALAGRIVISDVHLHGSRRGEAPFLATVVVNGSRIERILPPGTDAWRRGDTLVRGNGGWLIPGLCDAAVDAVEAADLRMMVYAGVTSVVMTDEQLRRRLQPLASFEPARLPTMIPAARGEPVEATSPRPHASRLSPPRALLAFIERGSARPGSDQPGRAELDVEDVQLRRSEDPLALVDPVRRAEWVNECVDGATGRDEQIEALRRDVRARAARLGPDALPGSGALAPFQSPATALLDEFRALGSEGWSNESILDATTRRAAAAFDRADAGRIAPGAVADLILLDRDPEIDLAVLSAPRMVFLRGSPIYRSELLSVPETLVGLRRAQADPFASFEPLTAHPTRRFAGAWRIDVDGLPRAAVRVTVDEVDGELVTTMQRAAWEPEWSRTRIVRREDQDGRLRALRIAYGSRVGRETIELTGHGQGWLLRWTLDGEEGSVELPARFAGQLDEWTLISLDALPMPTDLRRLASDPVGNRRDGLTIMFGPQTSAIGPTAMRRLAPEGLLGTLDEASAALQRRDDERLVALVVGSVDAPVGSRFGSSLFGLPPAFSGTLAVFTVDADGWPRRGLLVVPEGVLEAHPIPSVGFEAPTPSAPGEHPVPPNPPDPPHTPTAPPPRS